MKRFPIGGGRDPVLLFETGQFTGQLKSSGEGAVHRVRRKELSSLNLVDVMLRDSLAEFRYVIGDGSRLVRKTGRFRRRWQPFHLKTDERREPL